MARCGCSSAGASGAAIANSTCITATGAGTPASPFVLAPKVDPDTRNLLSCGGAGLLVTDPDNPGTWSSYTPTWSAAGFAPSIGNGTISGIYRKRGHTLEMELLLLFGSTTFSGSGVWYFGLPAGLTCGFHSTMALLGYNSTTSAFVAGAAVVNPGSTTTSALVDSSGSLVGGVGQGNGSSYTFGGIVYTTT